VEQNIIRRRNSSIQSVHRAVTLLKALGDGAPDLGVAELSRQVHLHKSTVSRLLSTLLGAGLVERTIGSEKYHLGYELVRLASHAPHVSGLRITARPFLEELAARSKETVHLAVLDGAQVINIEQISGAHLIGDTNWVGRRTAVHCVANGKALVAFRSTREIKGLLAGKLRRYTERTITNKLAFRTELAHVRRLGFAAARGEIEVGLNAVAAPVRDRTGYVVAAISVSGPSYRMTRKRMSELGLLTVEIADKISERLGYAN
jgi:IclR family transcriptional regulator, KDG regulon repressor